MYEKSVKTNLEKRIKWIREKGSKVADTSTLQGQLHDMEGLMSKHSEHLGKGATNALAKQIDNLKKKIAKSGNVSYEEELRLLEPYYRFVENNPDFNKVRKARGISKGPKTTSKRGKGK